MPPLIVFGMYGAGGDLFFGRELFRLSFFFLFSSSEVGVSLRAGLSSGLLLFLQAFPKKI